MRYAPRKYDPAMIEALALNGALDPAATASKRADAIARVAGWLGKRRRRGGLVGRSRRRGRLFAQAAVARRNRRLHHRAKFLTSAEARKLHALAAEQVATYASPSILKTLKKGGPTAEAPVEPSDMVGSDEDAAEEQETKGKAIPDHPPVRTARRGAGGWPQVACRSSATRALAK